MMPDTGRRERDGMITDGQHNNSNKLKTQKIQNTNTDGQEQYYISNEGKPPVLARKV